MTTRRANLDQIEGYAQANLTTRDTVNVQGATSIPLVPGKLALRAAALGDFNRGGQVRNILLNKRSSADTMSGRLSLAFQPTANFRANLTYQYFWSDVRPLIAVFGPGNAPYAAAAGVPGFDIGLGGVVDPTIRTGPPIDIDDRSGTAGSLPRYTNETHLITLTTETDISDSIVWSVDAGYQDSQLQQYSPGTVGNAFPGYTREEQFVDLHPKTYTVDTRISSSGAGPFNFTLGVFYSAFRSFTFVTSGNDTFVGQPGFPLPTLPAGANSADSILNVPSDRDDSAVFGTLRYNVNDALRVEAGLRYSQYKFDQQTFFSFCLPAFGLCPVSDRAAYSPSISQRTHKALTGGATLSYDWGPSFTTYLAYGHSYRPPAAQTAAALSGTTNPLLLLSGAEKSDAFEVGAKASLFDRRISISLNGFYQKYDGFADYFPGLQVRTTNPLSGAVQIQGITTTVNGDALSKGIEMQLSGRVTNDFDLSVSSSYVDASYKNAELPCNLRDQTGAVFIPAGEEYATCTRNDRLARVPKFSATANGEYRFQVGDLTPFVRSLVSYRPGFFRARDNYNYREFINASLFLGLRGPQDRWEISIFSKNLLNQTRAMSVSDLELQRGTTGAPFLSGYRSAVITNPREFGLSSRLNW